MSVQHVSNVNSLLPYCPISLRWQAPLLNSAALGADQLRSEPHSAVLRSLTLTLHFSTTRLPSFRKTCRGSFMARTQDTGRYLLKIALEGLILGAPGVFLVCRLARVFSQRYDLFLQPV